MQTDPVRRSFLLRTIPGTAALCAPWTTRAQGLPDTARILTGYPPGGSLDVICRRLAERLTGRIARNVIVENKTGAAGRLAIEAMKTAPADGTAMVVTPASVMTMYPHIYKNLSYDVFADVTPVSIVALSGFALVVGPAVPAAVRTLDGFLAWCRANPPGAQCGNPGAGSLPHFLALLLAQDAKVDLTHVPYRGGLLAMQAVAGGQVSSALATESSMLALEQAGRVRVLATTGVARSEFLPQAPTFHALGYPNLAQREWFAAFMPARTPPPVVSSAGEAIRSTLREPAIRDAWRAIALQADGSSPEELRQVMRTEHDFWGPVIRASGFTPEA